MSAHATRIVVVTGLSGAGKSTALAALEDLGLHAIENLPPSVVASVIDACEAAGVSDIALGFGGSVGAFLDHAVEVVRSLEAPHRKIMMIFLDASDDVVLRRFNESRRPHPETQRTKGVTPSGVLEGVQAERARLGALRGMASVVIDTSRLSVHELKRRVFAIAGGADGADARMRVRVVAFGFKYGIPSDADVMFDVRFLDNPHFVPDLKPLTGADAKVRDYVLAAPGAKEFLERTVGLLSFVLPRYAEEGKAYLTIAIGCTGGQHRSVAIADAIARELRNVESSRAKPSEITVVHRDARNNAARSAEGTP